jgi:hypothetical protein
VQVLPGISSLDELFAQLMIDPCRSGLQMYEATDLLLRKRPLQADVPLVIWQVGNLETRLHTTAVSRPERFTRFVAHLGQFYPASHPVTLFFASPHPLMRSTVRTLPLGALPSAAAALHPGITLVLPPIQERAIADPELARLVDDPAHLARITRG